MGKQTGISWTDHTFNCWHGCTKVSSGCDNCYAETLSKRWGRDIWGPDAQRLFFGDKHWAEPERWNKEAIRDSVRRRVFCGSMCDWAEGRPDQAEARDRLFGLIEATPQLDWLLLTKRPGAIRHLIPAAWLETPPANVWYGTSVENQEQADRRIPQLLQVPAVIRFLSCEPLLGPVNIEPYLQRQCGHPCEEFFRGEPCRCAGEGWPRVDWVIAGGESGPGARPMHPDWARSLRDQTVAADVAYHFKQRGEWTWDYPSGVNLAHRAETYQMGKSFYRVGKKLAGRELDGVTWDQFPETEVSV